MAYNWKADLQRLEAKYNIPPGLLGALVRAESGGNQNARSPVGAVGLTQLMPATAKGLGVNPNDPRQNLEGGAKYLSQQLKRFKSVPKALAAYNAGPGAVQKYGGIPPYKETQTYVKRLTGYWKESSRYGTQERSSATSRPAPRVSIPKPLPEPQRQIEPGLEDHTVEAIGQAYYKDPEMGRLLVEQRQRKQNEYDQKYQSDLTAYETRQNQIRAAQAANQSKLANPVQHQAGWAGQSFDPNVKGSWSPNAKYVKTPGGWVRNLGQNEQSYQFLQRVGRGFGLRNDPGNAQTTGGRHTAGSNHYSGRAIDFGDARNSRQQLMTFAQWARNNAPNIRELYYAPLGYSIKNGKIIRGNPAGGHDDHLHIAW